MNFALLKVYIETGVHPSIIARSYSKLFFFNNSAIQGGALYSIMPSLLIVVWSLIKPCLSAAGWRCRRNQGDDVFNDDIAHERIKDPELEPLINDTPRHISYHVSFC